MYQPRLVRALEMVKRNVERASVEAKTSAREEARADTGRGSKAFPAEETSCARLAPGTESVPLQSLTVQYFRDTISAEQFHEAFRKMKGGGKVEEAVVAKLARGMPEDKAWALMEAHRKWKRVERLNKENFRASRRAQVVSSNIGELPVNQAGEDDR